MENAKQIAHEIRQIERLSAMGLLSREATQKLLNALWKSAIEEGIRNEVTEAMPQAW